MNAQNWTVCTLEEKLVHIPGTGAKRSALSQTSYLHSTIDKNGLITNLEKHT